MPANRSTDGRFLPGMSGNPSGRPRVAAEVVELAREKAPAAIERLEWLMFNAESEQTQAFCACALLDRGYGKPVQGVVAAIATTTEPLTGDSDLDALAADWATLLGAEDAPPIERSYGIHAKALPAPREVDDEALAALDAIEDKPVRSRPRRKSNVRFR